MGNTTSGGGSYKQLGKSISMATSKSHGKAYFNGESHDYEKQSVFYSVDDRTCTSSISKFRRPGSNRAERFVINITDSDKINSWRVWPYRFEMVVESPQGPDPGPYLKVSHAKTEVIQDEDISWLFFAPFMKGGGTNPSNLYGKDAINNNQIKTISPDGTITLTSLNFYRVQGNDKQKGLVAIELKKKSLDQSPFAVIVSHYFASLRKTDAGFSVVAKMRGDEDEPGGLQLEGPHFHPGSALVQMFDKVLKTGHWNPNACPHCADQANNHNNNKHKNNNLANSVSDGGKKGSDMRLLRNGGLESVFNDNRGVDRIQRKLQVLEPESESEDSDSDRDARKSFIQHNMIRSEARSMIPSDRKGPQRDPNTTTPNRPFVVKKNYGTVVYQQ